MQVEEEIGMMGEGQLWGGGAEGLLDAGTLGFLTWEPGTLH